MEYDVFQHSVINHKPSKGFWLQDPCTVESYDGYYVLFINNSSLLGNMDVFGMKFSS